MENYEKLAPIGEGTYGIVMKCRHRDSGQIVAIKKFKESDDDAQIRKTALREVRMLKQLKHENIVNLFDVFRRKGKLFLVFEHVDHTILEDLEKCPSGLSDHHEHGVVRKVMYQLLCAVEYLHSHNVIHRDIKPENILVTANGIIKLCDFGFARTLAGPGANYTDYVATRWYRAPELLVGDTEYGKPVDIWAVGCIFSELLTSQPLFPGDSDIDQLYRIMKCQGQLTRKHMEIFLRNPLFIGLRLPDIGKLTPIESRMPHISSHAMNFLKVSLLYSPDERATAKQLLSDVYFTTDSWHVRFEAEIHKIIQSGDFYGTQQGMPKTQGKKKKKEDPNTFSSQHNDPYLGQPGGPGGPRPPKIVPSHTGNTNGAGYNPTSLQHSSSIPNGPATSQYGSNPPIHQTNVRTPQTTLLQGLFGKKAPANGLMFPKIQPNHERAVSRGGPGE